MFGFWVVAFVGFVLVWSLPTLQYVPITKRVLGFNACTIFEIMLGFGCCYAVYCFD